MHYLSGAGAVRLQKSGQHAGGQEQGATAIVADQIQGRHRRTAAAPMARSAPVSAM